MLRNAVVAVSLTVMAALLALVFLIATPTSSESVAGLIGLLLGTAISALVQLGIGHSDRQHQLRLASLNKRLEAHQSAYTLWRQLMFSDRASGEIHEVVLKCQDWWEHNCLYLAPEARQAFVKAYLSAQDNANLIAIHADSKLVREAWKDVERAGPIIASTAALPSIGSLESRRAARQQRK